MYPILCDLILFLDEYKSYSLRKTLPLSGVNKPDIILNKVDFPTPELPYIVIISLELTSNDILFKTDNCLVLSLNDFDILFAFNN